MSAISLHIVAITFRTMRTLLRIYLISLRLPLYIREILSYCASIEFLINYSNYIYFYLKTK